MPRITCLPPGVTLAELDASPHGTATLEEFYRTAYAREFPDPDERESLGNMRRYLELKARGGYGRNNYHILVAFRGGEAVGGVVANYLALPNAGVIEFLFVVDAARRCGLGEALLAEIERYLRADARTNGARLAAIAAEMNDPFHRSVVPDNMDPVARAMVWGKWGFERVPVPYVQPALSDSQDPVHGLALIVEHLDRRRDHRLRSRWIATLVGEYMRWAMRIAAPERTAEHRSLCSFLATTTRVETIPLAAYVGRDPARPFEVEPACAPAHEFDEVIALAHREIGGRGRVAARADFIRAAQCGDHHLWALRATKSRPIEGMASFFALPKIGFGGYLVLAGSLRGKGLLAQLVARIELQMLADDPTLTGWVVEVVEESRVPFERVGFTELSCDYRPPSVGATSSSSVDPERLHLLYKRFGCELASSGLSRDRVLDIVVTVLAHVYGVTRPRDHPTFTRVRRTLASPAGAPGRRRPGSAARRRRRRSCPAA